MYFVLTAENMGRLLLDDDAQRHLGKHMLQLHRHDITLSLVM